MSDYETSDQADTYSSLYLTLYVDASDTSNAKSRQYEHKQDKLHYQSPQANPHH